MAQRERHNSMGSVGIDYPRKRTAIACEICRTRRSKCDAKKPACSKCVELEVECVYRKPNLWDREPVTAAATAALGKVDDRLDQIQDSISALAEQVGSIVRLGGANGSQQDYNSPAPFTPQTFEGRPTQLPYQNQSKAGPPSYGSLSSARAPGHRMPNLFSFSAPAALGTSISYDYSESFFTAEVETGTHLYSSIESFLSSHISIPVPADFTPQTCWRLQRAFVSGFLRWMPIFNDETCFQHIQTAQANQFADRSASSCLTLLMFAIGCMSVDNQLYSEDPYRLPGFPYLALAYKILNSGKAPLGDIAYLQCRCLFSAYLNFAMRPVQSWHEINQVTRDCMLMLKTNWKAKEAPNSVTSNLKSRTFWVAYVIENELEVCLELPSSGIRTFQEALPLPTSQIEEEGLYFFLALISLRKLLAEVIETIGFKSGHAIYVPIVAMELHNQTLSWHEHLPASLQFPLDASPIFDLRRAHLRGQLFCLLSVVYWPFVLKCVDDRNGDGEREAVLERAKECLVWCVLHLQASEGIMMQKTLVSHAALRAFYAILMVLLLTYESVHQNPPPEEIVQVIKRSLDLLSIWAQVPFMREPLRRVCYFAAEQGIMTPLFVPST